MICATCGTENPAESSFCDSCGARLTAICATCGSPNRPEARFCAECGSSLFPGQLRGTAAGTLGAAGPAAAAGATARAPESERRLVTVLFADLVGFTPFAEERDAEDVRETLTRYFELASQVIGRYGGTVEKFIGDAVMAVWGAPTAHEDDAERAVRAGLELVDAVRVLGPAIQARVGVLTGEAAVTLGATNQGMVAGDLVNTAARLQSVAPPGAVLVGEATERAASRAIAFEPLGEQTLKGKASPVPAWRALRVVAERGGRNRSETLEGPFVGREAQLRLLKDLFHATGTERRARLVSVTGIGGIGKSRLAWEFLKYLDGLVEQVRWHHGRSPAYGEGVTFWALGEMIRGRAGLLETDDEATTRAKVAATVAEHVADESERRWIEPALLALLGVESGVIPSEQLFAAWRAFFEHLAETSTVIMVFEDLQWADAGLLEFIDQLLEWSRAHPIYVLTLARPELLEKRSDWGAGKRSFTSVHLEPLPEPAMRDLLGGLVPGLSESSVRSIIARADGVPLYAVETVRMLVAEGKLRRSADGTYTPSGDLGDLAVPETLTALIAARLDGLEPAERALIQDAAVLGQSFTRAALAAISGHDEASLEPRLLALVRRELLAVAVDPRSPERGQIAFVQELIREVAYNTLAKRERMSRHLAAARYFEALGTDELAGVLAGHYLAAYRNAQAAPEAEALAAQARIALRGAAERAAGLGAHEQAIAFLREALTVTNDQTEEAELLERTGESAGAIQRFDEAGVALQSALERREGLGDRAAAAWTTSALGRILLDGYRLDAAVAVLEPASAHFADLAPDPAVIGLDGQLARAYYLHSREGTQEAGDERRRAVAVADRVLDAAEKADLVDVLSDTLVTKGTVFVDLGRRREGLGLIGAGKDLADANGLLRTVQRALNNLSNFLKDDDPRAGLEAARAGLAVARRLGARIWQQLDNAFGNALRTGEWDWALAEVQDAVVEETDPFVRNVMLADMFVVAAARGEPTAELLAEMERLAKGEPDTSLRWAPLHFVRAFDSFVGERYAEVGPHLRTVTDMFAQGQAVKGFAGARAALWSGDTDGAAAFLEAAVGTGRHGRVIDTEHAVTRAGIAALEERADEALAGYREALRTWRDLGCVWNEALCAIDMAVLLDPALPEVRAAGAAAREILVGLKAKPFIEKLDDALGKAPAMPGGPDREAAPPVGVETGARVGYDPAVPTTPAGP